MFFNWSLEHAYQVSIKFVKKPRSLRKGFEVHFSGDAIEIHARTVITVASPTLTAITLTAITLGIIFVMWLKLLAP